MSREEPPSREKPADLSAEGLAAWLRLGGRVLAVLGKLAGLAYPFLVLWVLSCFRGHLREICLWGLPLLVLVLAWRGGVARKPGAWVSALFLCLMFAAVALTDAPDFLKLYPILVTGTFLLQFGASLVQPPSMIERFATLMSKQALPPEAVRYCRKVTWVWCGFFVLNIIVSALTALYAGWTIWTLYNGCISYILMGCLFGGEWLVRRFLIKQT